MPEPVCLNGTLDCAQLLALINSSVAIAGIVACLLAVYLGAAFVRAVWA